MYASRSELVHGAEETTVTGMQLARRAYALCFLELGRRVSLIPTTTGSPVGDVVD